MYLSMSDLPNTNNIEFLEMFPFLKSPKGRFLVFGLIILIICIVLGIIFYNKLSKLNDYEPKVNEQLTVSKQDYYEGKISYIGELSDNISYALVDGDGKEVALLKSEDSKLKIVEGLKVKVYGNLIKGSNNQKDILVVKEILINNGTN